MPAPARAAIKRAGAAVDGQHVLGADHAGEPALELVGEAVLALEAEQPAAGDGPAGRPPFSQTDVRHDDPFTSRCARPIRGPIRRRRLRRPQLRRMRMSRRAPRASSIVSPELATPLLMSPQTFSIQRPISAAEMRPRIFSKCTRTVNICGSWCTHDHSGVCSVKIRPIPPPSPLLQRTAPRRLTDQGASSCPRPGCRARQVRRTAPRRPGPASGRPWRRRPWPGAARGPRSRSRPGTPARRCRPARRCAASP